MQVCSRERTFVCKSTTCCFRLHSHYVQLARFYNHPQDDFVIKLYWISQILSISWARAQDIDILEGVTRGKIEKSGMAKGRWAFRHVECPERVLALCVNVYHGSLFKRREVFHRGAFHRWGQATHGNPRKFTGLFALKTGAESRFPRKCVKCGDREYLNIFC